MRNPSAYGAWNVQRVATGTGEALPGPPACVCWWSVGSYNRSAPGNGCRAGWASEAVVVPIEPSGQQNRR